MIWTISLIAFLLGLVYVYLSWNNSYWRILGVPAAKSTLFFGSFSGTFLQTVNKTYEIDEIYRKFKNKTPYVGVFAGREPQLLVIDAAMCKNVMVTNFQNFQDNHFTQLIDKDVDKIFGRNPFALSGNEWKEKRAEVTPAFNITRMKAIYPIVNDVCSRLSQFIKSRIKNNNSNGIDAKELASRFTIEVVSKCIYGIDSKSFTEENSIIRQMASKVIDSSRLFSFHIAVITFFPIIRRFWKMPLVPHKVATFFTNLAMEAVKIRENGQIDRDDYLNYLLKLRKKKNLSDIDVAAHTVTFLSDGTETTSVSIMYALYLLAKHSDVQEKLRLEVRENIGADGRISFEILNEMKYLKQIINETLRMYPPAAFSTRICNTPTQLSDYKDKTFMVEKGTILLLPFYSIQRDPDNYENPNKFDPERFSEQNGGFKRYRDDFTFLTFGEGPRICLGIKFSELQLKLSIAEIVNNFTISVNSKTTEPVFFDPEQFLLMNIGGIHLDLDFQPI